MADVEVAAPREPPAGELRISYRQPRTGQSLQEIVYVDRRDKWCSPDGGTLLVPTAAVEALQCNLQLQRDATTDTIGVLDAARRNYLREHQYLIEELGRLAQVASLPTLAAELRATLHSRLALSEAAAEDAGAVADEADQLEVISTISTVPSHDDKLLKSLRGAGIKSKNELTLRYLLKRIHAELDDLIGDRDRLALILEGLENPGDLLKALIAAATQEGATLSDVIMELYGLVVAEQDDIEAVATKRLKTRYVSLLDSYGQAEEKATAWRRTLAMHEEREAAIFNLDVEVKNCEEELVVKQEKDGEDRVKRRNHYEAEREAALAEEAAIEAYNASLKNPDINLSNFFDKLSTAQQMKIRGLENQIKSAQDEAMRMRIHISNGEEELESREVKKDELRGEIGKCEREVQEEEDTLARIEQEMLDMAKREMEQEQNFSELEEQAARLAEELEAAMNPPKSTDIPEVEAEIAVAEARNRELEESVEYFEGRQHLYLERVSYIRNVFLARQEELAAEEFYRKLERGKVVKRAERGPRETDPQLQPYYQRVKHPDYADMPRFGQLHTDDRARVRRCQKGFEEHAEVEHRVREARAQPVVYAGIPGDGQRAPLNFRHDEDLRVKLGGASRHVEHVESAVSEREERSEELAAALRGLVVELAARGRAHLARSSAARRMLEAGLGGVAAPLVLPDSDERAGLLAALGLHASRVEEAEEAWEHAERRQELGPGCGEAELAAERRSCTDREEAVVLAGQELYRYAASGALAEAQDEAVHSACRSFCQDVETAAPSLDAAKAAILEMWPLALRLASDLDVELAMQGSLQTLLREKERSRRLLDTLVHAPPEARQALASVRAALRVASHLHGLSPARASPRQGSPGAGPSDAAGERGHSNLVVSPRRAAGLEGGRLS